MTGLRAPSRLAGHIVMGVVVALTVVGCTTTLPAQNNQTPDEAHEAVRAAMASTIEFLGGPEGWSEYPDGSPEPCRIQGVEGVEYTEIQSGPGVASTEERDKVVAQVQEHLESLGMRTWLGEKTAADPMVRVLAEGGPTEGFSVYVDTEQVSVRGESWCVPGNAQDMILEGLE